MKIKRELFKIACFEITLLNVGLLTAEKHLFNTFENVVCNQRHLSVNVSILKDSSVCGYHYIYRNRTVKMNKYSLRFNIV